MAKRLDAKALKGAFARGKTKRNLDFLVPSKESEVEAPQTEASETTLTRSGPQRRKHAAEKRTAAKRGAAKRKKTSSKAKTKAPVAKPKATKAVAAKRKGRTSKPKPASSETQPEPVPSTVAEATPAPSCESTRVVHTANGNLDLQALEAALAVTALYDGWAPGAAPSRPGLVHRATARLRRVCDRLIGAAVRGILG